MKLMNLVVMHLICHLQHFATYKVRTPTVGKLPHGPRESCFLFVLLSISLIGVMTFYMSYGGHLDVGISQKICISKFDIFCLVICYWPTCPLKLIEMQIGLDTICFLACHHLSMQMHIFTHYFGMISNSCIAWALS